MKQNETPRLWIARDKDGSLCLHQEKPFCSTNDVWYNALQTMFLNKNYFPEITFENSPRQVELKLCNDAN